MTEKKPVTPFNKFIKGVVKIIFAALLFFGLYGLFTGRMFDSAYGSPIINLLFTLIFPLFFLWPDIVKLLKGNSQ